MNKKANTIISSGLIGVCAYMCADISHEVIGHAVVALIAGNTISLLTSAFFRSIPGSIIIDLGGPLSNMFFGLLILWILKYKPNKSFFVSFLVTTIMAYNLFWFSGTLVQSGFGKVGDWTFAVAQLNIEALAKPLLVISGIIAYYIAIKLVANGFSNLKFRFPEISLKQSVYYAYLFGILASILAGLFFAPNRISASKEGLLEMLASLPILFINKKENQNEKQITVTANLIFCVSVCVLYFLFCVTLGKGIYF
jgi:hypothetical protein